MTPTPTKGATFQPVGTGGANNIVQSAALQIEIYVQAVLAQPVFAPLKSVPDLVTHQQECQKNAQQWIDAVRITLYQSNSDLMAFANMFDQFYAPLYKYAGDIDSGDNRKNFIKGLQVLSNNIDAKAKDSKHCVDVLGAWDKLLSVDSQNFTSDLSIVEAVYEGDKGQLQSLKDMIYACSEAINTDSAEIGAGAGMAVVGGLTIAVGLLAEIPSGGTATAVVVAGVAVVAGGAVMIGIAAADQQKQINLKADLTTKLAQVSSEVTIAHSLDLTLTTLSSSCKVALKAANSLLTAWQTLQTNFSACIDAFQTVSPDDSVFIQSELEAAKKDWEAVGDVAKRLQSQLIGIPVTQDLTKIPQVDPAAKSMAAFTAVQNHRKPLLMAFALQRKLVSSESDNFGSIVQSLTNSVNYLRADAAAINNLMDFGDGLKQKAQHEVQSIQDKVVGRLKAFGTEDANILQGILSRRPIQVDFVKAIFSRISTDLNSLIETTSNAMNGASQLVIAAGTALQASSTRVDKISAQMGQENAAISILNDEITKLQTQVIQEQAGTDAACVVFPVLCPAVKKLGSLISHKDDLLRQEREDMVQRANIGNSLRRAEAELRVRNTYVNAATSLSSHTQQLIITFHVLAAHLSSVAHAANDQLVNTFVQTQGETLVDALRQLAGKAPAPVPVPVPAPAPVTAPALAPARQTLQANVPDVPVLVSTLEYLSALTAVNLDIASSANILVLQPNITLNDVTSFAEQFQLARDHAEQFNLQYTANITLVLAYFRSLSYLAISFLGDIEKCVARKDFKHAMIGILTFQQQIKMIQSTIETQRQDLLRFLSVVKDDQSRFIVLADTVPKALDDSIKKLSSEVYTLQSQIAADNSKISRGATDTILKVYALGIAAAVAVGVGTIAFPVAAGAGELTILATKALNASIQAASAAAKKSATDELISSLGGSNFLNEAGQRIEALSKSTVTLVKSQQSLAIFQIVNVQVQQIATSVQLGVNLLNDLYGAVAREGQPLQLIVADYQKQVPSDLTAVGKTWTTIGAVSQQLIDFFIGIASNAGQPDNTLPPPASSSARITAGIAGRIAQLHANAQPQAAKQLEISHNNTMQSEHKY